MIFVHSQRMSNTNQVMIPQEGVITHRTKKTPNGFGYVVELVRYQKPNMVLKVVDGYRSRAIATNRAKLRKMYFKACQKHNLLATL